MPRILVLHTALFLSGLLMRGQTVTNGNFSAGTSGWGCNAEVNTETTYGGSNGSNNVNEVDAQAGLCQTINGFVIGKKYYLSIDASRRTGGCPSPAVTNMDVSISGGVLSATITRTNTAFGFMTFGFPFQANSTTHTIAYSAGSGFNGSTCGMIVDNIIIAAAGTLPVELIGFDAEPVGQTIQLSWQTATERNNDHFEVQRSANGIDFSTVLNVASKAPAGNSLSRLDYKASDAQPLEGAAYYRLKQLDKDGEFSFSKLVYVSPGRQEHFSFSVYPNPNNGVFQVSVKGLEEGREASLLLFDPLGAEVFASRLISTGNSFLASVQPEKRLAPGLYYGILQTGSSSTQIKIVIE